MVVKRDVLTHDLKGKVPSHAGAVEYGPHLGLCESMVPNALGFVGLQVLGRVAEEVDHEEAAAWPQTVCYSPGGKVAVVDVMEAQSDAGDVKVEEGG
jgi:hypothetical protein